MISVNYETEFKLDSEADLNSWISSVIKAESFTEGEISFIFCDDQYLLKLNREFLDHDTLTDIISFDNSIGKILHGDIYISVDRARENANEFGVSFMNEIQRLMVHGILHYCGYKDRKPDDAAIMREKEDFYLERLIANS
jgi:rRNA maturation RNase YbeY